ncbi:MAG TPA: metalloregulator ArsR/SmtB family transcription factor [Vicinamibacterales bacterium]|nr:metalloregulator ArsR/SmtB family transcription factor [Vicinamibacterales bacterium]
MSDVFRALADPTRREILRVLRLGPQSAGALADRFPQSRSTLTAHFNVLRAADLVQTDRRGQTIYYRLNLSVLQEAIAVLLDTLGAADAAAQRTGAALTRRRRARA